jgi:hypothetical protein
MNILVVMATTPPDDPTVTDSGGDAGRGISPNARFRRSALRYKSVAAGRRG